MLCNFCLHFARQDGQDGKKTERKSHNLNYQNTKILRNLCSHFARQDGQDGKKTERSSRN